LAPSVVGVRSCHDLSSLGEIEIQTLNLPSLFSPVQNLKPGRFQVDNPVTILPGQYYFTGSNNVRAEMLDPL